MSEVPLYFQVANFSGLTGYSQVDVAGVWYKSVNFGAERCRASPNWGDEIGSDKGTA
jgi:hypothetical protein